MARIDIHQHLWPEPFLAALRQRTTAPYLDGWTLITDTEAPYAIDSADHDPILRAKLDDDCEELVLGLSSPLGIETLPDGAELIHAWHQGVPALPRPWAAWAAPHLTEPDLTNLAQLLIEPKFVGLQIPATALSTPAAIEKVAPVLAVAERANKPVMVHPGPVEPTPDTPPWWPAVVGYVAQLQAAWWAWSVAGRALLPDLRICFVAGAGMAPVLHERHRARGGNPFVLDHNTFVETSSLGHQGVDALMRVLGVDTIIIGSDRPYATATNPRLGEAAWQAFSDSNPARLLGRRSHA